MRAAALAVLCCVACRHAPDKEEPRDQAAVGDLSSVVPGVLMVSAEGTSEQLIETLATDGYRFEYVAAASATVHLVKVTRADGSTLNAEETAALLTPLKERKTLRYVELNRVRQPR